MPEHDNSPQTGIESGVLEREHGQHDPGFLRANTINTNPRPGFLRENTVSMGFLTTSEILSRVLSRKNAGFCNSVSLENPHEGFLLTPSDSV